MKHSWTENPNGGNMLQCLLYTQKFLFLKNTKISIFGGISKFRLYADLGSFGQRLLHSQWLRACPKCG
jgi:hypothetical protein